MDITDSNMKAHSAWCHERGTERDRSGKKSSRRFHPWDMGQRTVPGEEIAEQLHGDRSLFT